MAYVYCFITKRMIANTCFLLCPRVGVHCMQCIGTYLWYIEGILPKGPFGSISSICILFHHQANDCKYLFSTMPPSGSALYAVYRDLFMVYRGYPAKGPFWQYILDMYIVSSPSE